MLKDISWYFDQKAIDQGEPGIYHSYMASLATALDYVGADVDPAWLVGASAFAFRIWVNEVMCPSAMSIFNWSAILPEAVEQAGYRCVYLSRMWDEGDKEQVRREQAHAAIVEGIDKGVPAVVWDIADAEWGVIIGYNEDSQTYETLTCKGKRSSLAFGKLGQNGINILSVAIPVEPNRRSREEVILNSLKAAVAHAEQKEWTDRPKYQNGLAGYDLWALLLDRWALIVKAGKDDNIPSNVLLYAAYYAGHYYSARCYARDYLKAIMNGSERLQKAASSYEEVVSLLKPIWDHFRKKNKPDEKTLSLLAQNVRRAKVAEKEGINSIKQYLAQNR
jgi:hypothetical protein